MISSCAEGIYRVRGTAFVCIREDERHRHLLYTSSGLHKDVHQAFSLWRFDYYPFLIRGDKDGILDYCRRFSM